MKVDAESLEERMRADPLIAERVAQLRERRMYLSDANFEQAAWLLVTMGCCAGMRALLTQRRGFIQRLLDRWKVE